MLVDTLRNRLIKLDLYRKVNFFSINLGYNNKNSGK